MKILKRPEEIILYSRPMCSWCQEVKAWLDRAGWAYDVRDVGRDAAAKQRAIEISGKDYLPVIEVDGLILGDFDAGQLEAFLRQHGYLD